MIRQIMRLYQLTAWAFCLRTASLLAFAACWLPAADAPQLQSEILFPPEKWHNHSSSIVELPNGDLFVAWFHGSGERTADDVVILDRGG